MNIYEQIDVMRAALGRIEDRYYVQVDVCAEWARELRWEAVEPSEDAGWLAAEAELDALQRVLTWYEARLDRLIEREEAIGRARDLVEAERQNWQFAQDSWAQPVGETHGYTTGRVVR